jgi:predicted DNA-binding transcriptional regulator AlpA
VRGHCAAGHDFFPDRVFPGTSDNSNCVIPSSMETQLLDDDAAIAQFLGNAYRGRRFLRYAELEALGLVDNRGSLQNWIDAGAFPRAVRIPGKYGKVLVWSAAEVAQLIARRFRERDEHPTEKETGNPEAARLIPTTTR